MMTVKDLIAHLRTLDQNARVVVAGYESGYNDINKILPVSLAFDVNRAWYDGQHEDSDDGVLCYHLSGKNNIAPRESEEVTQ